MSKNVVTILTDRSKVLKTPGRYIGSIETKEVEKMVVTPDFKSVTEKLLKFILACFNADSITTFTFRICALLASSGTTPLNFACIGIWEDITLDKIFLPFSVTAAEVSSHDVSIAKIFIF